MKKSKIIVTFIIFVMVLLLNSGVVFAATGDRATPYSANTKQRFTFQEYSWDTPKVVELQLISILTGADANTIVQNENQFNEVPASDEEWIFMEYELKYVSGPEEPLQASDVLYTDQNFYTNSGQKISPRDNASLSNAYDGYGEFDVELYPGGESKVYYGILVKKTVGYPLIRIATGYNESTSQTNYSWFSTDPNYHPLIPVSGISLSKANISLKVGEYESIIPTVLPSNATDNAVTWKSSNESIATVDATGKVTAVGNGTATITATSADGSITVSCVVWSGSLSVPETLNTVSSGYNSVKVSWEPVNDASGYRIYRATSKTGTYELIKTTTSTSYADTGLTTGEAYYYKVRAFRYVGSTKVYSSYTTVVSVKPIPSTPTSFKATKVSSTSAKVSWSKVSGASGYRIYRATSKTGTYSYIKTTTSSYYTNSGLTKGKTYYYKVIAYRMVGTTKVYSKYTVIVPVRL